MKAFLDTNIICDYLFGPARVEFCHSIQIINAAYNREIDTVISVQTIADAAYIYMGREKARQEEFRQRMERLCSFVELTTITPESARQALKGTFPDFEDEAQLRCAMEADCSYFITADQKILEAQPFTEIKAIHPALFLALASRAEG